MSRRRGTPRFARALAIILGLLVLFTLYYGMTLSVITNGKISPSPRFEIPIGR